MPIKSLLFLVSFFLGCFFSLRFPLLGILTYMSLYFFAPDSSWWGRAIAHYGIRYSFVAFFFIVVGCLVSGEYREFQKHPFLVIEKYMVLFLSYAWLSMLLGGPVTDESWRLIEKISKVFIFLCFMTRIVTSYDRYRYLRWVWVLGGAYLGYEGTIASPGMFVKGRLDGIGGPDFAGSSGLGVHLAASLPFVGLGLIVAKKWYIKSIALISGPLVVQTLVLSRTRGAFVAIIVGILVAITGVPPKLKKKFFLLLAVGILGALVLVDTGYWKRMDTISSDKSSMEESSASRVEIWAGSLLMLYDKPLGVGIGNFTDYIGLYVPEHENRASHNTFVRCWGDLGIPGFLVFIVILFLAYRILRQIKKDSLRVFGNQDLDNLSIEAFALKLALTIYIVGGLFTERTYAEGLWWLIGMAICLHRCKVDLMQKIEKNK